jgi:hypothetical protein
MEKCFLHPLADAVKAMNVPCAPGGQIHLCALCASDPDVADKVWEKYSGQHAQRIKLFKTPGNPGN